MRKLELLPAELTVIDENIRLFVSQGRLFSDTEAERHQKFVENQGWHTFSS